MYSMYSVPAMPTMATRSGGYTRPVTIRTASWAAGNSGASGPWRKMVMHRNETIPATLGQRSVG